MCAKFRAENMGWQVHQEGNCFFAQLYREDYAIPVAEYQFRKEDEIVGIDEAWAALCALENIE